MKIAYFYTEGRKKRLKEEDGGMKIPHEFFLGATELNSTQFSVDIFEINDFNSTKKNHSLFSIYNFCDISSCSNHIAPNKIAPLNNYDLIVASNEFIAFGVLDLKRKGIINTPFMFYAMGMLSKTVYNENKTLKKKIKNYIGTSRYTTLLKYAKAGIFIGEGEYKLGIQKFLKYKDKLHFVPFPVDTEFWKPQNKKKGNYLLFIGNDNRRDFNLLKEIPLKMPNSNFIFISNRLGENEISKNVNLIKGDWREQILTDIKIKELIINSKLIILPIKYTFQPSGQSVAQQCMSCGKAVAISKTPGLWETSLLKNEENILLINSDNAENWVVKITALLKDESKLQEIGKNARITMENYFSLEIFSKKITSIITNILFPYHNGK